MEKLPGQRAKEQSKKQQRNQHLIRLLLGLIMVHIGAIHIQEMKIY